MTSAQAVDTDLDVESVARPPVERLFVPAEEQAVGQHHDAGVIERQQAVDDRFELLVDERLSSGQREHGAPEGRRLCRDIQDPRGRKLALGSGGGGDEAVRAGHVAVVREVKPELAQAVGLQQSVATGVLARAVVGQALQEASLCRVQARLPVCHQVL